MDDMICGGYVGDMIINPKVCGGERGLRTWQEGRTDEKGGVSGLYEVTFIQKTKKRHQRFMYHRM